MITKTTMVVIFNLKNSHSLTFSFPTEEVFQVNGQNRPVANLPVVDFHSQPREMLTPKPLNTQLSVFLLVYWFSCPSRKVWTSLSVSDTDFLVFLATIRKLWQTICNENREGFAVHSSTWPSGAKGEWLISSWLKNTMFLHVCCYGFSRGRNPRITPQFMW